MIESHTDLERGERHDIEVEFISHRKLSFDGKTVRRLLVQDKSGAQFPLLATIDRGQTVDLKVGDAYLVEDVLGWGFPFEQAGIGEIDIDNEVENLRKIDPGVLRAATRFGIDQPFGIMDEQTTISDI